MICPYHQTFLFPMHCSHITLISTLPNLLAHIPTTNLPTREKNVDRLTSSIIQRNPPPRRNGQPRTSTDPSRSKLYPRRLTTPLLRVILHPRIRTPQLLPWTLCVMLLGRRNRGGRRRIAGSSIRRVRTRSGSITVGRSRCALLLLSTRTLSKGIGTSMDGRWRTSPMWERGTICASRPRRRMLLRWWRSRRRRDSSTKPKRRVHS